MKNPFISVAVRCLKSLCPLTLPLLTCVALLPFESARAVPASPDPVQVAQPDGTKFSLHLRGDEYFAWQETADGYMVVKDADGFWKFARPAAGRAEFRAIPNARVGQADPAGLGLKKRELPEAAVLREHIQKQREVIHGKRRVGAISGTQQTPQPGEPPLDEPPPDEPPSQVPVAGTVSVKNVVILACFSNHWDDVNSTVLPAYGRVDTNEFINLYNQVGYSSDGAMGSVRDYYKEVSYGKLTLDSVVTVWVRLPQSEAYYGGNLPGGHTSSNSVQMVSDAIAAADASGFDFSQADSDGDGWVDCIDIIHSGYGEEASGGLNPDSMWSIKGSLSGVVTNDGVKMKPFHLEPALRDDSGTGITRIGVICHETGHFFGLPDLYDTSGNSGGIGNWCIMAGGTWNNSGIQPAHFNAWCKVNLGFAKPVPIHSKAGVSLPRVEDSPVVGLLRDGTSNGEYFLVENRAKAGFDNTAQIYPGLVVYHVFNNSPGNNSSSHPHPLVKLEEADGNDTLGFPDATGSQAGDVWTSSSGLAGGFHDQTGSTNTSAMLYQSGVFYHRTNDAASYSCNALSNFSAAGSTMSFDATTLRTTPGTQAVPSPDYTVSWAAASQATKYELQEGARATLTSFADGAEDEEAMYDNWYLGGKAKRVSTNASYAGSYSYTMLSGDGSVHHMTMQKPFKVTTNTVISFRFLSHIASGNGYLKWQLFKDGGSTWATLGTTNGFLDPWVLKTNDYAALNSQGISAGDSCILRFLVDIENVSGWSAYPSFGFALDDISITGIEMDGYGSWTTLDNNVTATSYAITGKTNGVYAYRVQPFANSSWQGYGGEAETAVELRPVAAFSSPTNGATITEPATLNLAATVATNNTTAGNVRFYNGGTLLATFTAPPYEYAWSSVAAGNYTLTAQVDYNGSLISTSSPVNVTVNYQSPTLANDTAIATQNKPLTIPVLANDTDTYGVLAISSVTQPARGAAAIAGTNAVYTPGNFWYGADSFTYTATNIHGRSATATVSVTTPFPNFSSSYTNAVITGGAVAYWRLNESSGTTATDVLGGHNGTNNAGLVFGTNGPGAPLFPGIDSGNTAFQFPSNTSVSIPALNLNTNTVTIAAWIKRNGPQADGAGVFACRFGTTSMEVGLTSANAPRISWSGFVYTSGFTSMVVPDNTWTFMVLAVSSNQFRVYMATNATLFAGTNSTTIANHAFEGVSYIGWDPNSSARRFNGAIDEVAIYNQSLSQAQIAGLLQAAQTAQPAVTLTEPANGSSFNAASNITLTASVTTNGNHTIEKVQFYTNATLLAEVLTPPYSFAWSGAPTGSCAVLARVAYDSSGTADSATANITVTNANQLPVAGAIVMGAVMNQTVTLAATKVLAHCSDPDGDSLTITGVSATSTNGGTVAFDGTSITYTPVTSYVGADSFTYTLNDNHGGIVNGTVSVTVANGQSFNLVSARTLLNSDAEVTFYGVPNNFYALDWTHALTTPITWIPLKTNLAGGTGVMIFTNTPSGGNDFYRTRYVP